MASATPRHSSQPSSWLPWSLPLVWRRMWPVAVFLVIGIVRELYDQLALGYAPLPLGPRDCLLRRDRPQQHAGPARHQRPPPVRDHQLPDPAWPHRALRLFVAALVCVGAAMAAVLSRRTRRAHLAEIEACAGQAESESNRAAARPGAPQAGS